MSVRETSRQPVLFPPAAAGPRSPAAGIALSVGDDGFGRITFDTPREKVNILSTPTMERLDALLGEVRSNGELRGLVFRSAKPGMFIAGADVDEIEAIHDAAEGEGKARRGQQVFQRIADLAVPTVAAIGGPCLGGGCELALACDFRIASDSPKARIGLPEVRLGILPGFGGTQRLPRLVGLGAALDLILSGKTLDGRRAMRIGLADRVVPAAYLDAQAVRILTEALGRVGSPRRPDGARHDWRRALGLRPRPALLWRLVEASPPGRSLLGALARRRIAGKANPRDYPAPFLALASTVAGRGLGLARGLDNEARLVGELIASPTSKSLIFLFRAETAAKSDPGVSLPVPPVRAIEKAGIIGAGTMGAGIAAACAAAGTLVRLRDVSWEAVGKGIAAASKIVEGQLARRRIDAREAAARRAAISPAVDWTGFRAADLVVEAVVERLDVKREVFSRLEDLVAPEAILASNTSSIPIAEIAQAARRPERFIGMHFFNPVDRMPLVEVITHRRTDKAVTASIVAYAKTLGKTPIVVKDAPGFLVNRVLMPYLGEALLLFEEGAPVQATDAEMRAFGMPMGPFELLDRIGLDVAQHVSCVLLAAFGNRFPAPSALEKLTAEGRTGVKRERVLSVRSGREEARRGPERPDDRGGAGTRARRAAPGPAGGPPDARAGTSRAPDDQRSGDRARRRDRPRPGRRRPRHGHGHRLSAVPRRSASLRGLGRGGQPGRAARDPRREIRPALRALRFAEGSGEGRQNFLSDTIIPSGHREEMRA